MNRLAFALTLASLVASPGCRQPNVTATDVAVIPMDPAPSVAEPASDRCPPGTSFDATTGQCWARERLPSAPVDLPVHCVDYAFLPTYHAMVVPARPGLDEAMENRLLDEAAGNETTLRPCPRLGKITFSVPPGLYRVLIRNDDAKADSRSWGMTVMPDAATWEHETSSTQHGPYVPVEQIVQTETTQGSFARVGGVALAMGSDGAVELRVFAFEGRWLIDQFVLEDPGARNFPDSKALAAIDGQGVIVEPGYMFRARFKREGSPTEAFGNVFTFGRRLRDDERPIAPPLSAPGAVADVCPKGSAKHASHDCLADEPLVDPKTKPVRVTIACDAIDCAFFAHPNDKVALPAAAAWASEAASRTARGQPAWFGKQGDTHSLDVAPGRYATMSSKPYGAQRGDVFVEPLAPVTVSIRQSMPGTHCPTLAWFRPSKGLFSAPQEILVGRQNASAKRTELMAGANIEVKDGVVELRLGEMQPETAYIDQLVVELEGAVLMPVEGGASSVLAEVDGHVLRLDENRQVHVRYRVPASTGAGPVTLTVWANGYYERHDGK